MKKLTLKERVRQRLRRWLIPRSNESIIGLTVEIDGADQFITDLGRIEARLDSLLAKCEAAEIALHSLRGKGPE